MYCTSDGSIVSVASEKGLPCDQDGSIVSMAAGKGLTCDQDCNSREGKISRYSGPTLPEVQHNGCVLLLQNFGLWETKLLDGI